MGALGPVINAFKTGISKIGGAFDIAIGSVRAVGQAFSATKNFFGGLFSDKEITNPLEEKLASGDAMMESDSEGEIGSVKNPMFVDLTSGTLEALESIFGKDFANDNVEDTEGESALELLDKATRAFEKAQEELQNGNLGLYQDLVEQAQQYVDLALEILNNN